MLHVAHSCLVYNNDNKNDEKTQLILPSADAKAGRWHDVLTVSAPPLSVEGSSRIRRSCCTMTWTLPVTRPRLNNSRHSSYWSKSSVGWSAMNEQICAALTSIRANWLDLAVPSVPVFTLAGSLSDNCCAVTVSVFPSDNFHLTDNVRQLCRLDGWVRFNVQPKTHYRSYWGQNFMGKMTQPIVSKHWRQIGS